MDPLGESIVKQLQLNFKAKDDVSRQIIAEEVVKFISSNQGVEEEDVAYLEAQIRHRLAGKGTTGKAEKLGAKQAGMKNDQWSKVCLYMVAMAKEDEKHKAAAVKSKQAVNRTALEAQMAQAAQRVQAEKAEKQVEHAKQEQELEGWRKAEAEWRAEQKQVMAKLKEERSAQLEEQARRKEIAAALKAKGEEEMTVRIALEMKRQMEAEAAAKVKAKAELKSFLLSNETNERLREEARQKEFQEDIRYMKEYAAQLEKQELERLAQLERTKAVQARQAEDAKSRPPVKKFVDPAIIEKQFQEKQAALAAEEARRKAAMAQRAQKFKEDVASQLAEKERARLEELEARRRELEASMQELELSKKLEAEAKAAELAKVRELKASLDRQIAEKKAKRELSSMSETERKLNARLLLEIEEKATIPAVKL